MFKTAFAALFAILLVTDAVADPWNVAAPTFGGAQVWTDVAIHDGWRVQENAVTGHFRLLDPVAIRRAWGGEDHCRAVLAQKAPAAKARGSDHLVVLVHGLGRTRQSMAGLAKALQAAGYDTLSFGYASTRGDAMAHGRRLNQVLDGLSDVAKVSFATHSYGGLVLRAALAQSPSWRQRTAVGGAVLIAPPSQGSALADRLTAAAPYRLLGGPGGWAVTTVAARSLPAPDMPFMVVAGGRGDGRGFNPWLAGDDDGVVRVAETRLPGAAQFVLVPEIHTFIMHHPHTVAAITGFLDTTDPQ